MWKSLLGFGLAALGLVVLFLIYSPKPGEASADHFSRSMIFLNAATVAANEGEAGAMSAAASSAWIENIRKALEEARLADLPSMNKYYPEFGDRFRDDFVGGLERIVKADSAEDAAGSIQGQMMIESFGTWYNENRQKMKR